MHNLYPQRFAGLPIHLPAMKTLVAIPQFVAWKSVPNGDKKPKKIPVSPITGEAYCNAHDPKNHGTYEQASAVVSMLSLSGVGYVLSEDDNLTAGDLDNCINEKGEFNELAQHIIGLAETYCEISPSGRGIRFFSLGKISQSSKRDDLGIELYQAKRFLTVTGNHIAGTPTEIRPANKTITFLCDRITQASPSRESRNQPLTPYKPSFLVSHIKELLKHIDPDMSYAVWIEVGQAIHCETSGREEGYQVFDEWSSSGGKYQGKSETKRKWKSFKGVGITGATIAKYAKDNGADTGAIYYEHVDPALIFKNAPALPLSSNPLSNNSLQLPLQKRGKITFPMERSGIDIPEEIVRGMIPAQGIGFLGGQSGALKTFTAIELIFCVMTDEPFAGCKIDRQGAAIYCAFEGEGTLRNRFIARASKLPDMDLKKLPVAILEGFGPLQSDEDYIAFEMLLIQARDNLLAKHGYSPSVIMIDTVAAASMIPADKENDSAAWQWVFDHLKPISEKLGAPIILVHHYGKDTSSGLRGSSNNRAGADFIIAMTCQRDEQLGTSKDFRLVLPKNRDGNEGVIADVEKEIVTIGVRDDLTPFTSLVLKYTPSSVQKTLSDKKETQAVKTLKKALEESLIEIDSIAETKLKDCFATHYKSKSKTENARKENVRRQFAYAVIELTNSGELLVQDINGENHYSWAEVQSSGNTEKERNIPEIPKGPLSNEGTQATAALRSDNAAASVPHEMDDQNSSGRKGISPIKVPFPFPPSKKLI